MKEVQETDDKRPASNTKFKPPTGATQRKSQHSTRYTGILVPLTGKLLPDKR